MGLWGLSKVARSRLLCKLLAEQLCSFQLCTCFQVLVVRTSDVSFLGPLLISGKGKGC